MVTPKSVARDPLSTICVNNGPGASLDVMGIVGDQKVFTYTEV